MWLRCVLPCPPSRLNMHKSIYLVRLIRKLCLSEKNRVLNQVHALLSHTALHCSRPCGYYCPPIMVMQSAAEYLYDMYPLKIDQDIMTTRLLWYLQPELTAMKF